MKKQITFIEIFSFFLSMIIAFFLYGIISSISFNYLVKIEGLSGFLLNLIIAVILPAFFSILVALIFTSWRYKIVVGIFLLFAITGWSVYDIIQSTTDFWSFVRGTIGLSCSMSAALAAIYVWHFFRNIRQPKRKSINNKIVGEKKTQKTSIFLLGLSLLSIPLTYITMFLAALVTLGFSALFVIILLGLPHIPIVARILAFITEMSPALALLLLLMQVVWVIVAVIAPILAGFISLHSLCVMFFYQPPFQSAHLINLSKHPKLKKIIYEICEKLKTKIPDNVILQATPTFYVTQSKMRTYDGLVSGRTLALGMPLIKEINSKELRALLAHEFAHFSGRDTFYSILVSPVYRGLCTSISELYTDEGELINFLVFPSLLFLRIFSEFFLSIDMIISRGRELRADWIASTYFGSDTFATALKKVVQYIKHFSEYVNSINLKRERSFFSQHSKLLKQHDKELQKYIKEALQEQEEEFDTHPSLSERISSLPLDDKNFDIEDVRFLDELKTDEKKLSQSYVESLIEILPLYEEYSKVVQDQQKGNFDMENKQEKEGSIEMDNNRDIVKHKINIIVDFIKTENDKEHIAELAEQINIDVKNSNIYCKFFIELLIVNILMIDAIAQGKFGNNPEIYQSFMRLIITNIYEAERSFFEGHMTLEIFFDEYEQIRPKYIGAFNNLMNGRTLAIGSVFVGRLKDQEYSMDFVGDFVINTYFQIKSIALMELLEKEGWGNID